MHNAPPQLRYIEHRPQGWLGDEKDGEGRTPFHVATLVRRCGGDGRECEEESRQAHVHERVGPAWAVDATVARDIINVPIDL